MLSVRSVDPIAGRPGRPVRGWPALVNPAAVAAAVAAALAGHAVVATYPPSEPQAFLWILGAAAALGAGGGVLQAPVSVRATLPLAAALLVGGVAAAAQASVAAEVLAMMVVAVLGALRLAGGRRTWLGPLMAGLAFAALFLLGAAENPAALSAAIPAAAAPFCYGAAFGIVGHGAVWRGDRRPAFLALGLLVAALLLPLSLGWLDDYAGLSALPFALVLAWWVLPDFLWGASDPRPLPVRTALTTGRLSAPALAAALAAGFAGMVAGLLLLLLVPLAGLLERVLGERS